jgi:uncharacterized protein
LTTDRDRDAAGRARNARPRDGLGRPLSFSQAGDAVATMPDDLVLDGWAAARLGDELLRAGRPFHAHEVFEASWKSGAPAERELWQGLAQLAVGLTHAHRGNAQGAVTLLRRGAARVRAYCGAAFGAEADAEAGAAAGGGAEAAAGAGAETGAGGAGAVYGMDLTGVLAACEELAARIERQGLAGIPVADLRPRLLAPGQPS